MKRGEIDIHKQRQRQKQKDVHCKQAQKHINVTKMGENVKR